MRACELDASRTDEWEALVAEEGAFSLMQSSVWGAFKERLGWHSHRAVVDDDGTLIAGAQVLVRPLPLRRTMAYVPRGPIGRWREPEVASLLFPALDRLAREHGAVFLKIEPSADDGDETAAKLVKQFGYQPSSVTNQPRATIVIDIEAPPDEILKGMRSQTRRYVRRAEKEGITVRAAEEEDLPAFVELMKATASRRGFESRSLPYYQAEWEALLGSGRGVLLLAYHEGQLIAGRSIVVHGRHAAELQGGSIVRPGLHANYLLVWLGILWARDHGAVSYDLWGIPDEVECSDREKVVIERHDGLWGVYQFKRGFCTNIVRYIGAYDKVFQPALHRLLESPFVNRRMWERVATMLDSAAHRTTSYSKEATR